ncbi:MAG TPA: VWA domain-containing protein [Vicinamibacterales bacterium]
MSRRAAWCIAFCGLLGGVFVSTSARQAAAPDRPRPTFRTEANYVRVDVYPTKSGTPIADLTREDFEVLENGQPQRIDQFERVVISSASQESRVEPNTVAESRAMLSNSRARVFVVFLDTYHVDVDASRIIRKPLTEFLDRMLGPDDLIAVMTPEMSPQDMVFARKTTTIDGFLEKYWHWGERDGATPPDPEDVQYGECYPNILRNEPCADQNGVAAQMIDRRHEVRTLGALENLVRYLRGVREERKAVLTVSDGWLLFKPNYNLMRPLSCEGVPTAPGIVVDPKTAKPTTKGTAQQAAANSCAIDRTNLAQIDNDRLFRDIQDEANRANASFYTIDPRGLAIFDTPIQRQDVPGPAPQVTGALADAPILKGRTDSLRNLAGATDGMAVVSSDLLSGMRRIVDDLSSYYLLGYSSSGKLDGKFHSITVRVKRPGVQVRARRGYLAATTTEVEPTTRAMASASNASSPADSEPLAVESALQSLSAFTKEAALRLRATAGWKEKDGSGSAVWVAGELGSADAWSLGAQADVTLTQEGQTLASAQLTVPPGSRHFRVLLSPNAPLQPGDYSVNVQAAATSRLATTNDVVPLVVRAAPVVSGSLLFRKGPFTGIKEVPTADLRFRRSEQMRIEIPAGAASTAGTARLLDRNGKAMTGVPLSVVFRDDPDGSRWAATQVPLSPLGPGDYIVEMRVGESKTMTPFRMMQ